MESLGNFFKNKTTICFFFRKFINYYYTVVEQVFQSPLFTSLWCLPRQG